MFLKRFKEKSIQKYYRNVLNIRRPPIHSNKINSVGILLDYDEYNNYDKLRLIFKDIGIKDNRIKFLALISDEKSQPNHWDSFFYPECFGWKGKFEHVELEEFVNTPFDALICFYNGNKWELNLATALSKANFKIGVSNEEPRLYDLIINIETKHIDVFHTEMLKYLKQLNKI